MFKHPRPRAIFGGTSLRDKRREGYVNLAVMCFHKYVAAIQDDNFILAARWEQKRKYFLGKALQ